MAVELQWQGENGEVLGAYDGPPLTWEVLMRAPAGWTCVSSLATEIIELLSVSARAGSAWR